MSADQYLQGRRPGAAAADGTTHGRIRSVAARIGQLQHLWPRPEWRLPVIHFGPIEAWSFSPAPVVRIVIYGKRNVAVEGFQRPTSAHQPSQA